MHRRTLFSLAAASTSALALTSPLPARGEIHDGAAGRLPSGDDAAAALARFQALPGQKSLLVHVGEGGRLGRIAVQPDLVLFTASAFKTFVLGQYLRDVEAGRLSETEQLAIDDSVRMLGSPLFLDLTGKTAARSVLDAMIAYSDNTATDRTMAQVGADRVRALIAQAGLQAIRIPDSTRIFGSYIFGAPPGVDLGWPGILEAAKNPPGPLRPPLNNLSTMAGNARDFVSWYEQALRGDFFTRPHTLTEFKRIQSLSVQIPEAIPPDTVAYVKGGEVESFNGFNAKSFAGQMLAGRTGRTPVTFCFIMNWEGPPEEFPAVEKAFFAGSGES